MQANIICLITKDFLKQEIENRNLGIWLKQHFRMDEKAQQNEIDRLLAGLSGSIKINAKPPEDVAKRIGGYIWDMLLGFTMYLAGEDYKEPLDTATAIRSAFGEWAGGATQLEHHTSLWSPASTARCMRDLAMIGEGVSG